MTEERRFSARLDCWYLVETPERVDSPLLVVALHGYAMDAAWMLRLTADWFSNNRIASLQAPHPFYRDLHKREVGYSWATHVQSEESIRLHHEMILRVLDDLAASPEHTLLIGFSQPVGMNYRFAATHPDRVRGVIGVCGGMPKDWETHNYGTARASLLQIARTDDAVYPPSATRLYADRLRLRAHDVESLEFPGGHQFPSLAKPAANDWVHRKFAI